MGNMSPVAINKTISLPSKCVANQSTFQPNSAMDLKIYYLNRNLELFMILGVKDFSSMRS